MLEKLRQKTSTLHELKEAYSTIEGDETILRIVDTIFNEYNASPQAKYWISFLDMVEILTQTIHAIRTRNWPEFKSSMKAILPWMKICDNCRYGRHLPDFSMVLDSLLNDEAAYMENCLFAQSMSGNHYSCVALEIWIDSTMNKGSKLKSGWL